MACAPSLLLSELIVGAPSCIAVVVVAAAVLIRTARAFTWHSTRSDVSVTPFAEEQGLCIVLATKMVLLKLFASNARTIYSFPGSFPTTEQRRWRISERTGQRIVRKPEMPVSVHQDILQHLNPSNALLTDPDAFSTVLRKGKAAVDKVCGDLSAELSGADSWLT
ncbi:hypothetical protein N658DRAFT_558786 [Parathielavia hyrcaniae]|uniref:Uncharacterized protein n=1 Tax=Parathielavia hyrcaniae TaxID=113614 RepID=A0AAN6T2I5_9PEZI|nr:hypothetical protein N658DRAFT_558786 [Parathielavia hyrcaniae]